MTRRFLLIPFASILAAVVAALGILALFSQTTFTQAAYSGQIATRHGLVQPAVDEHTGKPAFLLLRPRSAPSASPGALGIIYDILYPRSSHLAGLHCLPSTCNTLHVAPAYMVADYQLQKLYPLQSVQTPYGTYFGGAIKGYDLLLERPGTGRTSNITWQVRVVFLTPIAMRDGAINRRIRTYAQLQDALGSHEEVGPITTAEMFTASLVPATSYRYGT